MSSTIQEKATVSTSTYSKEADKAKAGLFRTIKRLGRALWAETETTSKMSTKPYDGLL